MLALNMQGRTRGCSVPTWSPCAAGGRWITTPPPANCIRCVHVCARWMRLLSGTGQGEPAAEAVAEAAVRQAAVPGQLVPSPCPVSTSCLAMSSPQVFSAPCYPQFGESFTNLGAVAVLSPPAFDAPRFVQYEAAPRPQVRDVGGRGGAQVCTC